MAQTPSKVIFQYTLEEFNSIIPNFSPKELGENFALLQSDGTDESKEKLLSLFHSIDSPNKLESLAKFFSMPIFLKFLNFFALHHEYQDRLAFILVGLPPSVFCSCLNFLEAHHLALFKQNELLEPLQYHLNQFIHEGEALYGKIEADSGRIENEVLSIRPEELNSIGIEKLLDQMDNFRSLLLDYLERAKTALSIVWNTGRIDLIEKLSNINEALQYQLTVSIGHPSSENMPATGLYLNMHKSFSNIFNSSLKDQDASLEGLTRLSIWHLKDYWKLGLLPHLDNVEEIDLDPRHFNEDKRSAHHQNLFSQVQKQLENLHIGTVGDLKKKSLFSQQLLIDYIEKNRHLLVYPEH